MVIVKLFTGSVIVLSSTHLVFAFFTSLSDPKVIKMFIKMFMLNPTAHEMIMLILNVLKINGILTLFFC